MQIHGFNKTTLLDYPKHLAATIFIGGCNMRCPFCHNASLVTGTASQPVLPEQEILSYLAKRQTILEGVCITGGEPTLHRELPELITRLKGLGYKVKLDTNGTNPAMLKFLTSRGLLDYIAMDIKNSPGKYAFTAGTGRLVLEPVMESASFLLSSPLEYEFRTTVVKEHHTTQDMLEIGRWLSGAKAYYLQAYKDSGDILSPGLSSPSMEDLREYVRLLTPFIPAVSLRGV